jgi:ABC-type transporter MlaC component
MINLGSLRTAICALALFAVLILSAETVTSAQSSPAKETVGRVVALFVNWNGDHLDQSFSNRVAQHIDYDLMSSLVLGDDQWAKLSPAQQKSFTAAFRKLIEQRYYVRWHRIFGHGKLSYGEETSSPGQVVMKTQITVGEECDTVNWVLHLVQGSYKVVSLTTDHRDLLEILRPRFNKVLSQRGFDGLMNWLNRKASSTSR